MTLPMLWTLATFGCAAPPVEVGPYIANGEYGRARRVVLGSLTDDRRDRLYLLDRLRLAVLVLADGYPDAAQPLFEEVYDVIRTQGINRDKTVASVVLNEDLKLWKGEPFEQAMAMFYYGVQQATLGSWDNARAAATGSLFHLRDFGADERGTRLDTQAIAQKALAYERARQSRQHPTGGDKSSGDYLNTGYAVRESNFALGYLFNGIANQRLGREEEALDHYAAAVQINPELRPVCDQLRAGRFNCLLVVSHGLGPRKVGYGPDRVHAQFVPRFPRRPATLLVGINGEHALAAPVACDLDRMAADHMWNNLEDVRIAKSRLGSALMTAGAIATAVGQNQDSDAATYAGLGAMAAGLFLKAGAHADTRYCDALPQRVYIVPVTVMGKTDRIELAVEGYPSSRMILTGLEAPEPGGVVTRYVRLVSSLSHVPPGWAVTGRVMYANDESGQTDGPQRPYILGGGCVRTPSHEVLSSYQRSGFLDNLTTADLAELYRQEGVRLDMPAFEVFKHQHLLEGGDCLVSPMAGTTGFARLFGRQHQVYRPKSAEVRALSFSDQP